MFYNALEPTFRDYGLYEMGTTIFVGLVLALQCKVAFLHQVWNRVHVLSMILSVLGLFFALYVLNASDMDNYDYYAVVNFCYGQGIFWFFGMFSIPLICYLMDIAGSSYAVCFQPTNEMIYRENAKGLKQQIKWDEGMQ